MDHTGLIHYICGGRQGVCWRTKARERLGGACGADISITIFIYVEGVYDISISCRLPFWRRGREGEIITIRTLLLSTVDERGILTFFVWKWR